MTQKSDGTDDAHIEARRWHHTSQVPLAGAVGAPIAGALRAIMAGGLDNEA